jgi:hypothetical protein
MRKKISTRNDIPNSRAANTLAVTDGGDCIGRIVEQGGDERSKFQRPTEFAPQSRQNRQPGVTGKLST